MHEYSVALRISGKALDPAEVTAKLGLKPVQVRVSGQRRSDNSVWEDSLWEFATQPEYLWFSLEEGLKALLFACQPCVDALRQYQKNFDVILWCGHFSSGFDGGPTFSPQLLRQLADFGIELYLDTYISDE
ncbi:MAG TPA: DUF4279 domain-containing protein [Terriglobales bacterium]|jgi:hypothetical protein|nr:DUF4279 domain-containing protein [Terriglobales bacterium]